MSDLVSLVYAFTEDLCAIPDDAEDYAARVLEALDGFRYACEHSTDPLVLTLAASVATMADACLSADALARAEPLTLRDGETVLDPEGNAEIQRIAREIRSQRFHTVNPPEVVVTIDGERLWREINSRLGFRPAVGRAPGDDDE